MHAYIDESGNTGFNLFDPEQPYFLNVAMSSPVDFDKVFHERISRISCSIGVDRLHASELGEKGVEAIAQPLIEIIKFSQARFYFAFVNKPDVATIKFFDAVFDPGENPAAAYHTYAIRSLKFLLLLKFSALVDSSDAILFWNAMTSAHSPKSEGDAISAINNVLQRVDRLPDARSRVLIGDTLSWASQHIGELSFWGAQKRERYGHLPNLFTFPALMEGISESARLWNCRVDKIIHDRQTQFETTLKQWHSLFLGVEPEKIVHFGDTPIKFADIRESNFEVRDSNLSPGLQVVDIVLWTFSRIVSNRPVGRTSSELFDLCFSSDELFMMSLSWIETEVEETMKVVNSIHLSDSQLEEGRLLVDRFERNRQRQMHDFPEKR